MVGNFAAATARGNKTTTILADHVGDKANLLNLHEIITDADIAATYACHNCSFVAPADVLRFV